MYAFNITTGLYCVVFFANIIYGDNPKSTGILCSYRFHVSIICFLYILLVHIIHDFVWHFSTQILSNRKGVSSCNYWLSVTNEQSCTALRNSYQEYTVLVKIRRLKCLLIMSYWCSQFRYGAFLLTSFRLESHILPDNLTTPYCLLNDWSHRHHSRLKYSESDEKYPNNASRPKYIGKSKFSLVSWRISMLCDDVPCSILSFFRPSALSPRDCHTESLPYLNAFTILNEPPHETTNKMTCAPSEDSDQPGHPLSLIRVFAVRMKKGWVLSYPLSAQRRL